MKALAGVAHDELGRDAEDQSMLVAAVLQKYAAVFLFAVLWFGIAMAARGLLRYLATEKRENLGF